MIAESHNCYLLCKCLHPERRSVYWNGSLDIVLVNSLVEWNFDITLLCFHWETMGFSQCSVPCKICLQPSTTLCFEIVTPRSVILHEFIEYKVPCVTQRTWTWARDIAGFIFRYGHLHELSMAIGLSTLMLSHQTVWTNALFLIDISDFDGNAITFFFAFDPFSYQWYNPPMLNTWED